MIPIDEEDVVIPVIDSIDISFSDGNLSINENSGEQMITLNFSEAASVAGSITVSTSGTATYTDDYTTSIDASSGSFSIEVIEGDTSASFSFTPTDDENEEENETVIFTLSSSVEGINIDDTDTLTVTITDDDKLILVAFTNKDGVIFETDIESGGTLINRGIATFEGFPFKGHVVWLMILFQENAW